MFLLIPQPLAHVSDEDLKLRLILREPKAATDSSSRNNDNIKYKSGILGIIARVGALDETLL
jgi:hypothetical protein